MELSSITVLLHSSLSLLQGETALHLLSPELRDILPLIVSYVIQTSFEPTPDTVGPLVELEERNTRDGNALRSTCTTFRRLIPYPLAWCASHAACTGQWLTEIYGHRSCISCKRLINAIGWKISPGDLTTPPVE